MSEYKCMSCGDRVKVEKTIPPKRCIMCGGKRKKVVV